MPAPIYRNNKIVFAVAPEGTGDGLGPMLLVGISKDAFEYMKDGKTHDFDLSSIGVPIKMVLFGASTFEEARATVERMAAMSKTRTADLTGRNFSIGAEVKKDS
jgi:hypothetical protein